jgi:general secretion pathway protein D
VVGRLFSATKDTTGKNEIVLLITPRLVRTLARPDARNVEFAAGTEAPISGAPVPLQPFVKPPTAPVAPPKPAVPPPFGQIPGRPGTPATPTTPQAPGMLPFGGVQPGTPR